MVLFPPLISDGRLHSLRLESIHGNSAALRAMFPRPTVSFRADSFHKHFVIRYEPGVREEGVIGVGARVGGGGGEGPALPLAVPLLMLMAVGFAHWRRLKVDVDGAVGGSSSAESVRGSRSADTTLASEERVQNRKKTKPRKT
ncbi:hypothetical protein J437_LFUL002882 [Ladona fulva]|uniref:Uncharacterized protein n=1 Tax=Ladona fulva TaxID=123851 RepID=A0A8K0KRG5_LADFU|nr:hypothetical protein J437_LFUL002882 [Ladona fulva]